jgi:rare lipoprotein A
MEVLVVLAVIFASNVVDHSQIRTPEAPTISVATSWYGKELQGSKMANGKRFESGNPTFAAHKELPLGTRLQLQNPSNGHSLVVEITDRGPFVAGRDLDVSEAAAEQLGLKDEGVVTLLAKVVK